MTNKRYKLSTLLDGLNVEVQGNADCIICGIRPIQQASDNHITFLSNRLYRKYLPVTKAAAVILSKEDALDCKVTAIISSHPYYTYAKVAAFFYQDPSLFGTKQHASAIIDETAIIHPTACIGPHCVIGKNVIVHKNVIIGSNSVIEDFVEIDEETILQPKVVIHHHVKVGKRNRIKSGAVIGSDGFGFASFENTWHKVPQIGRVILEDDVEIGANTTIDRGALENTVIEQGVKLDNLIQVGHNVRIGAHSIVAGCVAIAGSSVIGKHCMIGGGTRIAGHLQIADHVSLTGMTAVTKSINEPGLYSSGIVGAVPNHEFRKNNARFNRLEQLITRVKILERALSEKK